MICLGYQDNSELLLATGMEVYSKLTVFSGNIDPY